MLYSTFQLATRVIAAISVLAFAVTAHSQWRVEKRRDHIRGSTYSIAWAASSTVPPGGRGLQLAIVLQDDPTNPDPDARHIGTLMISGAIFDCPENNCHVSARIGDDPAEILSVDISKDMRTLFLYPNGLERIEQAAKAKATIWLEVPVFRRGNLQYQFKLHPLPPR